MPWQETAVPFFVLEWAMRLHAEGVRVEVIWDAAAAFSQVSRAEENGIRGVAKAVSKYGPSIVTLPQRPSYGPVVTPHIRQLAFEAVTRIKGREPLLGEENQIAFQAKQLARHAGRVRRLLRRQKYDWVLFPGGVSGASAAYWTVCEEEDVPYTTFDSGRGMLCFQHGGPAAHFPDLAEAMQVMVAACKSSYKVRSKLERWVNQRINVRRSGEDEFCLQPSGEQLSKINCDVLIPLNYRIDTASMCRQRLFKSVNEWLHALVTFAKQTPDVHFVVRQHPCEKLSAFRSREDYSWVAQPNVRFVAASDRVNTYDLIEQARVILPYTSRVGLEAGVMGKPVLLAACTYYEKLEFVQAPTSIDAYFTALQATLRQAPPQADGERVSAYAGYFVSENFGLYRTDFTPIPEDFNNWVNKSPEQLWEEVIPATLLQAALSRLPAAESLVRKQISEWEQLACCFTKAW